MKKYPALSRLCEDYGAELFLYDETDSTNTLAKEYAKTETGIAVFVAEKQRLGRGTHGRSFVSPRGGLYMTVLLRPRGKITDICYYTAYTGVSLAEAIEECFCGEVGIKWVNDCYMKGRKVAGILTEAALLPGTNIPAYVAIGIGVNIAPQRFEGELSHTAGPLSECCKTPPDAEVLAERVARALFALSERPRSEVMDAYRRRSVLLGKEVTVVKADVERVALATDILDSGELVVSYGDGMTEVISSGDVRVKITGDDNEGLQNNT